LIAELDAADAVVIGTPMHNYTLPSTLKAWIDHVVRVRRSFAITPDGKVGSAVTGRCMWAWSRAGAFRRHGRPAGFPHALPEGGLGHHRLHDLRFTAWKAWPPEAAVRAERERIAVVLDGDFSRAERGFPEGRSGYAHPDFLKKSLENQNRIPRSVPADARR
jgi:FMN-dependent NADH-azoreductase